VTWNTQGGRDAHVVGHGRAYTIRRSDRGMLVCTIQASNAGGTFAAPFVQKLSTRRITR
jgi:hypothetical protein